MPDLGFRSVARRVLALGAPSVAGAGEGRRGDAVVGLALLLASRPRGTSTLVRCPIARPPACIAVQLPAIHWFYCYIVWFLPLVLIAAAAAVLAPSGPRPIPRGPSPSHGAAIAGPNWPELDGAIPNARRNLSRLRRDSRSHHRLVPERRRLPAAAGRVARQPGSHCPGCGTPIKPYDNVPVLGWLMLRGHCRNCGARSRRVTRLSSSCAALAIGVVLTKSSTCEIVLGLVLVAVLVPVALIDLE